MYPPSNWVFPRGSTCHLGWNVTVDMHVDGTRSLGPRLLLYIYQGYRLHREKKGILSDQKQPDDSSLFGEHPSSRSGMRKGSRKRSRGKKTISTSPAESIDFVNIDLEVEEPTVEVPPPPKSRRPSFRKECLMNIAGPENFL